MLDQTARIQAWFADLAAIVAELDADRLPRPLRPARKRARKLRPLWEE